MIRGLEGRIGCRPARSDQHGEPPVHPPALVCEWDAAWRCSNGFSPSYLSGRVGALRYRPIYCRDPDAPENKEILSKKKRNRRKSWNNEIMKKISKSRRSNDWESVRIDSKWTDLGSRGMMSHILDDMIVILENVLEKYSWMLNSWKFWEVLCLIVWEKIILDDLRWERGIRLKYKTNTWKIKVNF